MSTESMKDRLAKAREAKEKRLAAEQEAADARELEALELEEKLAAMFGARGSFFEMIDTVEGPIAVKLGEGVLHTRFQASKMTDVDLDEYVRPCVVHPTPEKYLEMVGRRPALAVRCASALATLFGAKDSRDAGKF